MLYEIVAARHYELIREAKLLAAQRALKQTRRLERMQKSARLIGARLGLAPAAAR